MIKLSVLFVPATEDWRVRGGHVRAVRVELGLGVDLLDLALAVHRLFCDGLAEQALNRLGAGACGFGAGALAAHCVGLGGLGVGCLYTLQEMH